VLEDRIYESEDALRLAGQPTAAMPAHPERYDKPFTTIAETWQELPHVP